MTKDRIDTGESTIDNAEGEKRPGIFAVVDVFDARISDRPYRKAWTKDDALAYIQEHLGKHFFPDAVRAYLELWMEVDH